MNENHNPAFKRINTELWRPLGSFSYSEAAIWTCPSNIDYTIVFIFSHTISFAIDYDIGFYCISTADMEIVEGTGGTPPEPYTQEWETPVMTAEKNENAARKVDSQY